MGDEDYALTSFYECLSQCDDLQSDWSDCHSLRVLGHRGSDLLCDDLQVVAGHRGAALV
jgi:hypothetical protein